MYIFVKHRTIYSFLTMFSTFFNVSFYVRKFVEFFFTKMISFNLYFYLKILYSMHSYTKKMFCIFVIIQCVGEIITDHSFQSMF